MASGHHRRRHRRRRRGGAPGHAGPARRDRLRAALDRDRRRRRDRRRGAARRREARPRAGDGRTRPRRSRERAGDRHPGSRRARSLPLACSRERRPHRHSERRAARARVPGARPGGPSRAAREGAAQGQQAPEPAERRAGDPASGRPRARPDEHGARHRHVAAGRPPCESLREMVTTAAQDRMRAIVEAGIALSSELSLDAVLQKLVEAAAELTGARYAALGVLDATGARLERFLTTGIDPATHALIGDLPTGRGILGVLIRDAEPLRLHDLSEDPRSVGFPPGHPPMHTFLGVPVSLRGVAYGNLYLTEKTADDFTGEDEETVLVLASQAAVAIENARLYESATRWSTQLESLNEVAVALVSEIELVPLLDLVADRLRELLHADSVSIALPHGDGLRIEAAAGLEAENVVGMLIPARSKSMRVLERAHSERVDSVLDDPEIDQES